MLGGKKANIKVGGDFGTVPSDKYTVQIADVNFKTMFNKFKNVDEERLNFKFAILDDKPLLDSEGEETGEVTRGKLLWHAVSQSLSSRSWLMKLAKAVYGRDLTKEELDPENPKFFDPEKVIGKQVVVMVEEAPNKDNTAMFNNIVSYSKALKQLPSLEVERTGQAVVESETKPATKVSVDVPNLNPGLDTFLDDLDGESKESAEESEEVEDQDTEEDSVEALEAKLKLAQKKAKEAKANKS